ncbi:MAG TPA: M14 family zinc carboxypeptidase [Luteitalea sp.]|nr:M14 family zinc carboxypeptidase [Luteitalea sp.]
MHRRDLLGLPLAVVGASSVSRVIAAQATEPLTVGDFSFEGPLGSQGASIEAVAADHFRVRLGAAPKQPGWPNKLNLRILRHARGKALRLDVAFPQGTGFAFNEYHQSFSYDGIHWHPIAWQKGHLVSPLADTLVLPPFAADTVWVGTQTPMSWDVDALGLIARWRQSPHVTVHTVGKTLGGRDMLRIEITDAASPHARSRRWVHYLANQHPGEHNSQWRLVGLVDWLLSDAGADVRQRQIVHVVLMMSPDAPANGWYRVNAQGIDMNRSYSPTGANAATQAHEAYLWQRDLEQLMASDAPVTTVWAIHTWTGIVEPQLIPGPELTGGLGTWTALRNVLATHDRLGLIEPITLAQRGQYANTTWTDGPHAQFGITAMLCEGGAALQTRQLNEASGVAIIKALGDFYRGTKPAR